MEKLEHPWHTIYEELPNPLKCKLVVAEWSRQVKDNVNYCIVTSTFFVQTQYSLADGSILKNSLDFQYKF